MCINPEGTLWNMVSITEMTGVWVVHLQSHYPTLLSPKEKYLQWWWWGWGVDTVEIHKGDNFDNLKGGAVKVTLSDVNQSLVWKWKENITSLRKV